MEDPKSYCVNTFLCFVTTLTAAVMAFYIGLILAKVNVMLLPLLLTISVYPGFLVDLRRDKLWTASALVLSWALVVSLLMIHYAYVHGMEGAVLVAKGREYVEEMFSWIKTGRGAEGDPSLFIVPKLLEITVFSLSSLATVGFAGLFLGSYLLDYMNFYVGVLLLHAKPEHFFEVALLSWQLYAILRVVGYVLLGTALSRISLLFFRNKKLVIEKDVRRMILYALILIILDFVLKGTIANVVYQPLLAQYTFLP